VGLFALGLFLLSPSHAAQTSSAAPEQQLQHIQTNIHQVRNTLTDKQAQKEKLAIELEESKQHIQTLKGEQDNVVKALGSTQNHLKSLEKQVDLLQIQKSAGQTALAEQFQLHYLLQQQNSLQRLLSASDMTTLGQNLGYLQYLHRARANALQHVQVKLDALAKVGKEVDTLRLTLEQQANTFADKTDALEQARLQRQTLLSQVNKEIRQSDDQLKELLADQQHLNKVITELAKNRRVQSRTSSQSFKKMKAKLPWPAQGPVKYPFGAKRAGNSSTWSGIFIAAPTNEDVNAVHSGRVVYADWLRGYGMLLIVDHGDGYMSLYAHNAHLYKHAGDKISAQEKIAGIGKSGGIQEPGLYFEIRYNGQAIDPQPWLKVKS